MNNTKIEWCDSTWNPVTGCLHGCEYCYARKIANRFGGQSDRHTSYKCRPLENGHALYDLEQSAKKYGKDGKLVAAPYPCRFEPTFHRYKLDEPQKWKKPRTIFVCSMADLFGEWVPDEWIEAVFEACAKAPQHRYLFLTKNSKRCQTLHNSDKLPDKSHMSNMWLGATITNCEQVRALCLEYLPRYANTFLSIEPLSENVAFELYAELNGIKWVIIGAETGNNKNKVIPEKTWIDSICNAADEAKISVFMKESLLPIMGEENMRREFPWEV